MDVKEVVYSGELKSSKEFFCLLQLPLSCIIPSPVIKRKIITANNRKQQRTPLTAGVKP
jgi:hypothetical protein